MNGIDCARYDDQFVDEILKLKCLYQLELKDIGLTMSHFRKIAECSTKLRLLTIQPHFTPTLEFITDISRKAKKVWWLYISSVEANPVKICVDPITYNEWVEIAGNRRNQSKKLEIYLEHRLYTTDMPQLKCGRPRTTGFSLQIGFGEWY